METGVALSFSSSSRHGDGYGWLPGRWGGSLKGFVHIFYLERGERYWTLGAGFGILGWTADFLYILDLVSYCYCGKAPP